MSLSSSLLTSSPCTASSYVLFFKSSPNTSTSVINAPPRMLSIKDTILMPPVQSWILKWHCIDKGCLQKPLGIYLCRPCKNWHWLKLLLAPNRKICNIAWPILPPLWQKYFSITPQASPEKKAPATVKLWGQRGFLQQDMGHCRFAIAKSQVQTNCSAGLLWGGGAAEHLQRSSTLLLFRSPKRRMAEGRGWQDGRVKTAAKPQGDVKTLKRVVLTICLNITEVYKIFGSVCIYFVGFGAC